MTGLEALEDIILYLNASEQKGLIYVAKMNDKGDLALIWKIY